MEVFQVLRHEVRGEAEHEQEPISTSTDMITVIVMVRRDDWRGGLDLCS